MKTSTTNRVFAIVIFMLINTASRAQQLMSLLKAKFGDENVVLKDSSVFKEYYAIRFRQPVDHFDTTKGFFMQTVLLGHNDAGKPMVIETNGYEILPYQTVKYRSEPAVILDANQLIVEHRYYGHSMPGTTDKTWLNFQQVSADYHALKNAFEDIYKTRWVSTGGSKGGVSALNYSFYFPKDMDATIVYAAPVLEGVEDERITRFLDDKRETATGKKIFAIQKYLFQKKAVLLPVFLDVLKFSGLSSDDIDPEVLYDFAVLEFDFTYWQYFADFDKLVSRNKKVLAQLAAKGFKDSSILVSQNDSMIAAFPMCISFLLDRRLSEPYFYQSFTEMGCYGYKEALFEGYLKNKNYSFEFLAGRHPGYSRSYISSFKKFLKQRLTHTILVYGAEDPFTSCKATIDATADNLLFVIPLTNHLTQLKDLGKPDKEKVRKALAEWLDTENINL